MIPEISPFRCSHAVIETRIEELVEDGPDWLMRIPGSARWLRGPIALPWMCRSLPQIQINWRRVWADVLEKAIVVLARRLTVIMHRIWVDGTEFRWTRDAALAA